MSASHDAVEVIGADVSQREIALAWARPERPRLTIANTRPAILAWIKQLPAGCVIGMEATGRLHQLLADLAVSHGHTVYVINPKRLASYAKGIRAACQDRCAGRCADRPVPGPGTRGSSPLYDAQRLATQDPRPDQPACRSRTPPRGPEAKSGGDLERSRGIRHG